MALSQLTKRRPEGRSWSKAMLSPPHSGRPSPRHRSLVAITTICATIAAITLMTDPHTSPGDSVDRIAKTDSLSFSKETIAVQRREKADHWRWPTSPPVAIRSTSDEVAKWIDPQRAEPSRPALRVRTAVESVAHDVPEHSTDQGAGSPPEYDAGLIEPTASVTEPPTNFAEKPGQTGPANRSEWTYAKGAR